MNVYLYEEELSNLYIHHDIVLPAFPLCLSWMNYSPPKFNPETGLLEPTTTGNMVAVGTFNPEIEIWDLDVLDAIEPTIKLGGILNQKGKRIPTKKNVRLLSSSFLSLFDHFSSSDLDVGKKKKKAKSVVGGGQSLRLCDGSALEWFGEEHPGEWKCRLHREDLGSRQGDVHRDDEAPHQQGPVSGLAQGRSVNVAHGKLRPHCRPCRCPHPQPGTQVQHPL